MLMGDLFRSFVVRHNLIKTGEPSRKIFIAATPRSGSSLLARSLEASALAGYACEFLNSINVIYAEACKCPDFSVRKYLNLTSKSFQSLNGVFSIKGMYDSFIQYTDIFSSYDFIYIERKNKIEQGISVFKLSKNEAGNSKAAAKAILHSGDYSFDEISGHIYSSCYYNALWKKYFRDKNINPVNVVYEDFIQDISGTISQVIKETLNVDFSPDDSIPPLIHKQADSLSEYYYNRYRYELKEKGHVLADIAFNELYR